MIDGGDENDIHPQDKVTIATRLYLQAMHTIYHHQDVDSECPRAVAARPDGVCMLVKLLSPLVYEKHPRLLEVAGEDEVFYPAEAEINGTMMCVASDTVAAPRFVRYAWVNYRKGNLFGVNGLPLAPFLLH